MAVHLRLCECFAPPVRMSIQASRRLRHIRPSTLKKSAFVSNGMQTPHVKALAMGQITAIFGAHRLYIMREYVSAIVDTLLDEHRTYI